tara:strand:- start:951 stop:1922 length:972 start_codon:yes stop_codon:yes gene_type:complete
MNYYGESQPQPSTFNSFLSGTNEFMDSNSAISNFAYIILVVIIFVIVMQMGINIIQYIFYPKTDVRLIRGMMNASDQAEIKQDPRLSDSTPIYRSNDERGGLEFTYSTWLYVESLPHSDQDDNDKLAHVFHKGEKKFVSQGYELNEGAGATKIPQGMNYPNNGPGLYLRKHNNNNTSNEYSEVELVVVMNTYPDETNELETNHIVEQISVGNIPMRNWVHVVLMVRGRNLDVYINGNIAKRHILSGVAKQNYGNIYAGSNGGFNGKLSNLTYFNESIGTRKIYDILRLGPDLRMTNNANLLNKNFDYLSLNWFLGGTEHSTTT